MKLRTKLIFFVSGVVIIPLLVSALIGFYLHRRREWVPSPRQMDRMFDRFEEIIMTSQEPDYSSVDLPARLRVWILDENDMVTYTNSGQAVTGERIDIARLDRGIFHIFKVKDENGDEVRVLANFPSEIEDTDSDRGKRRIPPYVRFLERAVWWIFTLIVFSAVMITLIVRSFNRSVRKLESATRRIAEGDLDFELEIKGKDEISSLTSSFDSMRRELKEGNARRSRFLMGVSHDLKTPLTSIEGYLEAIADGLADEPEKLERYHGVIQEKSKVLEERIAELIDYVNMETGEWRMRREAIELAGFFRQISDIYREDASVFNRRFSSDIALPEGVCVAADRGLLLRCFENLFNNSIRYTRENDTISLRAFLKKGEVMVVLEDTGMGIQEKDLDMVFEPFYRGTGSRREQGSGLGLSIVKSIIDTHGWRIGVESVPDGRTAFTIHISPVHT